MKKISTTLLMCAAVLFMASCSSDDDSSSDDLRFGSGDGTVTVDGNTFDFDKGIVLEYGENDDNGTFNFDIELFSGNISANLEEGISGTGNYMYLELNSDQESALKNGTYTFGFDDTDLSLTDSEFYVDYNFGTDDFTEFYNVTGGTVDLTRSGSNYTVTFDLEVNGSLPLTGSYSGSLRAEDLRED